ncbi:MAG: peptide chain release factor N(5)-glutamine methyltransferase [Candidatus Riflebacteria bacterium]|nr:peptide chain release factor N(5)-glutamine methyltransferase [Candidatus Riflebacteria bacterium]
MTIGEARARWAAELARAGLPEPQIDVDLLLAAVLGIPRLEIPLWLTRSLGATETARLADLATRRQAREPLQYLLGEWPFLDLVLEVGPAVLIPRPETEDWVGRLLADDLGGGIGPDPAPRFADVGTGTGAIGLALATGWPRATGMLIDLSPAALAVARRNLARYPGAAPRVVVVQGDLTAPVATGSLDLLVSNPPYVDRADLPGLEPEVRDHEPRLALDGGEGGLTVIARLLADAARVLRQGGRLAIEHGHGQRAAILALPAPGLAFQVAVDDAAGRERCLVWTRS